MIMTQYIYKYVLSPNTIKQIGMCLNRCIIIMYILICLRFYQSQYYIQYKSNEENYVRIVMQNGILQCTQS